MPRPTAHPRWLVGLAVLCATASLSCTDAYLSSADDSDPEERSADSYDAATGGGLKGEYFKGEDLTDLVLVRVDPRVAFAWGDSSPDPAIGAGPFSVRWTGRFLPNRTGTHTFYTRTDGGVRLWMDGKLLIHRWNRHSVELDQAVYRVNSGTFYSIKIEYYHRSGQAVAKLYYKVPGGSMVLLPQYRLFPDDKKPPVADAGGERAADAGISPQPDTSTKIDGRPRLDAGGSADSSGGSKGRTYPWHTGIIATTFWVGELFNASASDGSQVCSTYDGNWAYHWSGINTGKVPSSAAGCAGAITGGCDGVWAGSQCATEARTAANGYFPSAVQPKENPFYLDLPYDDLNDSTGFSQRCQVIPWANDPGYAGHCKDTGFSYMKNRWVRMVGPNGNTCYGQIEDAGPGQYHDAAYVFGSNDARPVNKNFNGAGADVSPALNGCLGFKELDGANDKISWQFVDDVDVPAGPWKKVVTTSTVSQ